MSKLKPCPFCGETATLDYRVLPFGKHWFITCDCCGMMYQDVISQRKYVKDDWNTRPIEDALRKRIAELEAAYLQTEDERDNIIIERWVEEGKLLKRIAELEAAQRWIPVSERLPKDKKHYMTVVMNCYDGSRDIYRLRYYGNGDWFSWASESNVVTHWKEEPALPEVQE